MWANIPDLIPFVCRHITDVHSLAALSGVNKALNNYLFSTTGGKHWIRAGKLVCGDEYWPQDEESLRLEETDPRYITKIRICPWISEPEEMNNDGMIRQIVDTERLESGDWRILSQLDKTLWAPCTGKYYGKMTSITKLHEGVSIIKSSPFAVNDTVFAYFISSKERRLLRDRFYLMKSGYNESWSVSSNGNLYVIFKELYFQPERVLRFGIRTDKAITPFPQQEYHPTTATIQAFWSAFRGDVKEALRMIASMLEAFGTDIVYLDCHTINLAGHVINGGSFAALKTLLEEAPCFINEGTLKYALEIGREDMAKLIVSKIDPSHMHPSDTVRLMLTYNEEEWSTFTNDKEELRYAGTDTTGKDINLAFAWTWRTWRDNANSCLMPPSLRLRCTVCASIPTSDGKQLVDIMRAYTTELLANYDGEDEETEDIVLLRRKIKSTMELLTAT